MSQPVAQVPEDAPSKLRIHACQRLMRWSIEYSQSWSGLERKSRADLLILSMHARSTRTYEAVVRHLGEAGMGEQGMMLNRSLFEDMVDIHWVHLNPDVAVEQLALHDRYSRLLRAEVAQGFPQMFDQPVPRPKVSNADRQRMRRLFGQYGQKSWTGIERMDDRLEGILGCWPTEPDRDQVRFWFEWVHKLSNETLHPSAWSLGRMMPPVPLREGEALEWRFGSTPEWLKQALYGALWTYAQTVGLVIEHFTLDGQPRLTALFSEAHRDFARASDWERTGRLEPLPDDPGRGANGAE